MARAERAKCQLLLFAPRAQEPGLEFQKKSVRASERDEEGRLRWREQVASLDARLLVFVDESGSNLAMTRLYGWAPKAKRALSSAPKNRGRNTTILGALSANGWQVGMTIEGAADRLTFEVFIEHYLLPTLTPGHIIVLDNLSIHKGQKVRELVEAAGCSLLFLPTYSPDFNPIEMAWSKLKTFLRKVAARTRDELEQAIGQGLDTISPKDANNWCRHCGYHLI